ncbi:SRPBCC family protein [Cellulomonas sp. 179-A 9B4 NHS]|uniref:SRPBCC family protein n=1 Tax=Cellulomonas sp. 179-A 9B4 NHS TaxID=3142379 RepID=UPI0039A2F1D9
MSQHQPSAVVDADALTVSRTVRLAAPRARVWAALTEADLLARWFGDEASLPDLRPGGAGSLTWHDHGTFDLRVEACDPQERFAFTWAARPGAPLAADSSTTVRFTLEDDGDGTLLTVVETGFDALAGDALAALEDHRGGWTAELDELAALVEAGTWHGARLADAVAGDA